MTPPNFLLHNDALHLNLDVAPAPIEPGPELVGPRQVLNRSVQSLEQAVQSAHPTQKEPFTALAAQVRAGDSARVRYRLVIFDFDGTLADSFPWVLRTVDEVADRFKFRRVHDGEMDELRSCDASEVMRRLGVPRWKVPMIARYVRMRMSQEVGQIGLFPGAGEMLDQLADTGLRLAVVSSNGEATIRSVLGPHARGVTAISGGVSLFGKRGKLLRMARLAAVEPRQVLVIGDEIRDLNAAKTARMAFGAVSWGLTRPEALQAGQPAALFRQMSDILRFVIGEPLAS